jgi:hypothetical protein
MVTDIGMALDIGVKTPGDSMNEPNGMVSTITSKASDSCMEMARNCGNIKRRNGGSSGTSSGTNATEILMLQTVPLMDQRGMDGRSAINSISPRDLKWAALKI